MINFSRFSSEKKFKILNFISLLSLSKFVFFFPIGGKRHKRSPEKRNKERKRHEKMKITSDAEEHNMHDDDRCVRKCLGKGMRKMSWWQWYRSYTWIRCLFERKSPWVCLCLHICFVLASNFDGPCFISPLYFSRIRLLHHHRKKRYFLCSKSAVNSVRCVPTQESLILTR